MKNDNLNIFDSLINETHNESLKTEDWVDKDVPKLKIPSSKSIKATPNATEKIIPKIELKNPSDEPQPTIIKIEFEVPEFLVPFLIPQVLSVLVTLWAIIIYLAYQLYKRPVDHPT